MRNHTIQLVRQRQHFAEPHNTIGSSTTAFCGTTQYNWFVNDSILRNHTVQLVHQGGYLAEYINKTVSTWFVKHDSTLWNMTLVQLVRQRRHIVVQLIERHFVQLTVRPGYLATTIVEQSTSRGRDISSCLADRIPKSCFPRYWSFNNINPLKVYTWAIVGLLSSQLVVEMICGNLFVKEFGLIKKKIPVLKILVSF